MRNRVRALRHDTTDVEHQLLPVSWDDDDNLHCLVNGEDIIARPEEGDHLLVLLAKLAARNIRVHGCFDCRYFAMSGMSIDAAGTIGYCIEGKLGQWLDIKNDTTSGQSSCDAYSFGTDADRVMERDRFHASRRHLGPYQPT